MIIKMVQSSFYNILNKNIIENEIPVLGICFGHQILSKIKGGKVKQSKYDPGGIGY